MSEKNQIVVVLIVALFLGALIDRSTALKIVAGVVLLWILQNQPVVFECIRKLFSFVQRRPSVREYRGGVTTFRASYLRVVMSLAKLDRVERPILTK